MAYPFTAIVGQEEMKLALILNLVDPLIGGVLIMGHRGTGKSTAVRALADLLPPLAVVAGCPYNCDPAEPCANCLTNGETRSSQSVPVPVVELPLGATEDRVCGTIDIERALASGRKVFDPGLLARANRGFLYIDEVNLLEDHLVDLLLDVAATGRNRVEREGVSIEHPASFVLIGSGNPEEGDLRPQLLDRFGLHAEVVTENYLRNRVDIVERRDAYDLDREAFCETYKPEQQQLAKRITRARSSLRKVAVPRPLLEKIAQLCADLKVDGHRGELTIMRAARALAAFEGRRAVNDDDVRRVSAMSLRHRLRRDALDETATSEQIGEAVEEVFPNNKPSAPAPAPEDEEDSEPADKPSRGTDPTVNPPNPAPSRSRNGAGPNKKDGPSPPALDTKKRESRLEDELQPKDRTRKTKSKTRRSAGAKAAMQQLRGRYTRSVAFRKDGARVAVDATLRAMVARARASLTPISSDALRYKLLKDKQGTLFIFAIDASGSMAANRIARAKSTILRLLRKSYLNRDSVAIVSFHGTAANLDLPPSRSILRARRVLDTLRMGGSTPLGAGLITTIDLINLVGDKFGETVVLLFTDGRSNVPLRRNGLNLRAQRHLKIEGEIRELNTSLRKTGARVIVVDTQKEFESSEETRRLAEILQAQFVKLAPTTIR